MKKNFLLTTMAMRLQYHWRRRKQFVRECRLRREKRAARIIQWAWHKRKDRIHAKGRAHRARRLIRQREATRMFCLLYFRRMRREARSMYVRGALTAPQRATMLRAAILRHSACSFFGARSLPGLT